MEKMILLCLLAVNLAAFLMYGADKSRARNHRWRIPEAVLLGIAFFGGAAGALLGMQVFHHKTRKWRFRILVPLFLILQLAALARLGLMP